MRCNACNGCGNPEIRARSPRAYVLATCGRGLCVRIIVKNTYGACYRRVTYSRAAYPYRSRAMPRRRAHARERDAGRRRCDAHARARTHATRAARRPRRHCATRLICHIFCSSASARLVPRCRRHALACYAGRVLRPPCASDSG